MLAARLELIYAFALAAFECFQGKQVRRSQGKMGRIAVKLGVHPIYITVQTARAELSATMPGVPSSQFSAFPIGGV